MDAPDDRDLKLQKAGSGMISDLKRFLPKFLYPSHAQGHNSEPRQFVRQSTTTELIDLLEPFQEWPQLLDPQLGALINPLTDAFLKCMGRRERIPKNAIGLVLPLQQAICKLLYTLCKIRGPKTVMRFLQNEARYLEPVLDSLQSAAEEAVSDQSDDPKTEHIWEEKYVLLLWLSHLILTPFDLSTVGSAKYRSARVGPNLLKLPKELPNISLRLVYESVPYLSSPSKEREAAVKVLIRLSLRPDMIELGLHASLIHWSLLELEDWAQAIDTTTPYALIGHLSFLAGIIMLADARVVFPFLLPVFRGVQALCSQSASTGDSILSAVARKTVVKIYRSITLCSLQLEALPGQSNPVNVSEYVLEEVIDYLLTSMADRDTPVRYAASKALSMITIKLEPDLAAEVTEAVTGSLGEKVLWEELPQIEVPTCFQAQRANKPSTRNLTAVNPLRWHGLTLSLSQLLFQRSPPTSQIPPVLNSLILTLNFEQRGSSGTTIGANVRDAANFGVWSLARRYSTKELEAVQASAVEIPSNLTSSSLATAPVSVIQILAVELVQAACLDPSGNIRRGSSAALQELIGRHPDTVAAGISVVQTVDYHAVALRQRAMESVAIEASKLDAVYWDGLLNQLLGWRGVCASDAPSRRVAACAIGLLSRLRGFKGWHIAASSVWTCLKRLRIQDIEKRHGLLLSCCKMIEASWEINLSTSELRVVQDSIANFMAYLSVDSFKDRDLTVSTLRPDLTAEAVAKIIAAVASTSQKGLVDNISSTIINRYWELINLCVGRRDVLVTDCVSEAAKSMLIISDQTSRIDLLQKWIRMVRSEPARTSFDDKRIHREGLFRILERVFFLFAAKPPSSEEESIWDVFMDVMSSKEHQSVEIKVAALKGIQQSLRDCYVMPTNVFDALFNSLQDYTTDQRGDIGSLVRLAGLDATEVALKYDKVSKTDQRRGLAASVARLAVERMDKVRLRAYQCLRSFWQEESKMDYPSFVDSNGVRGNFPLQLGGITTSQDVRDVSASWYYESILNLCYIDWLRLAILSGYITSSGTGSESVLQASRNALSMQLDEVESTRSMIGNGFLEVMTNTYNHPRLAVSMLETLAFILQTNTINHLTQDVLDWRSIYKLTQSSHAGKAPLEHHSAAVVVYFGLAVVPSLRKFALKKLATLLLHPHAKIRNAAADSLYVRIGAEFMEDIDWSKSPKELKGTVEKVKKVIEGGAV